MVSRKKAAGKARKAAKANAKEERNNHTMSIRRQAPTGGVKHGQHDMS